MKGIRFWTVLLLVAGAAGAGGQTVEDAADRPEGQDEVMAALATTGQGMSPGSLSGLAGPGPGRGQGLVWWRSRGQVSAASAQELRARGRVAGFGADGRIWRWIDGSRGGAGWVGWAGRQGACLLGGWGWRGGFGLVAGGAGRRAGLTADAGLGARGRGLQRWGRAAEARTVWGGVIAGRMGEVVATLGTGKVDGVPIRLGSLASNRRTWELLLVVGPRGESAAGAWGRWRRDGWLGSWEVAVPVSDGVAVVPALAGSAGWRSGRGSVLEALVMAASGAPASLLAAPLPLLGPAGGRGWALRGSHRFADGPRVALLVSRAEYRDDEPGPQQRNLVELLAGASATPSLAWEASWRLNLHGRTVWREGWPWLPPGREQGLRRGTVGLALKWRARRTTWRLGMRSLAVDGAGTTGRRSLINLEVRTVSGPGWSWRGGHTQAWGDPVDLVSVLVPAPGRVVARHWGRWRSETWLGLGLVGGPWRLAASAHHRESMEDRMPWLEWRVEAGAVR